MTRKAKTISPELEAIRKQGERARAQIAWDKQYHSILGGLADSARQHAQDPRELFLHYLPAKDGAWGSLTIAPEAPAGFIQADERSCNHIAYDRMASFYDATIRQLPICGDRI